MFPLFNFWYSLNIVHYRSKVWNNYFLKMFLKSCAHQGCIELIQNAVKTEILWILLQFKIMFSISILMKQSWIFGIITSVFSVAWSFRNQNILICCSRNISYYSQYWKPCGNRNTSFQDCGKSFKKEIKKNFYSAINLIKTFLDIYNVTKCCIHYFK